MKLVRFGDSGHEQPGILDEEENIRDLSGFITDLTPDNLSDEQLNKIRALDPKTLPIVPKNTRLGPPLIGGQKFVAIGLNYSDHAEEVGAKPPREPIVFTKHLSCISGPNDTVYLPPNSQKADFEVEIGFVIGKRAKNIPKEGALQHVAGYFIVNDVSERAFQLEHKGQWVKGKSYDTFGPIGPWLVTRDEVENPQELKLWLELNGEIMQNGTTANMIFTIEFIISYLSRFFTLLPGDMVCTGTPAGVGMGRTPPRFLQVGDVMRLGIEKLGIQQQNIARDSD